MLGGRPRIHVVLYFFSHSLVEDRRQEVGGTTCILSTVYCLLSTVYCVRTYGLLIVPLQTKNDAFVLDIVQLLCVRACVRVQLGGLFSKYYYCS